MERCRYCGAPNLERSGNILKCKYCNTTYKAEEEQKKLKEEIRSLLDEAKAEHVAALRQQLYEKVNAQNVQSEKIVEVCRDIRKELPDDFIACFYEVANGGTLQEYADFLNGIDVEENYPFVESVIKFTARSLSWQLILPLEGLVERAFQAEIFEPAKYNELQTLVESEVQKVNADVYNPRLPRDFFMMYSSRDMDKIIPLVNFIEEQGYTCFLAMRNMQHGRGARENYEQILQDAMDYCKCVVFISSTNSRRSGCDAYSVEMDYIRRQDIQHAPPEYRSVDYAKIPLEYKKRRIEYLIEKYTGASFAEKMVKEFFSGMEYVKADPEDLLRRYIQGDKKTDKSDKKDKVEPEPPIEDGEAELKEAIDAYRISDFEHAFDLFEASAKCGNARALCNLGYCYELGRGINRDCDKAFECYEKAAKLKCARAQYNLAVCYESGIGTAPDHEKSESWLKQAAANGEARAIKKLKTGKR